MAVKSSDQITIVDLTDGYSIMLSLDAVTLNGGVSTLGSAQSVTVNVTAYKGGAKVVPTVGTCTCPTNVSASVGSASNSVVPVTITFAAALAAAGKVTIPVSVDNNTITINKEFAYSIAFKGAKGDPGSDGVAAYTYKLVYSHYAIVKHVDGSFYPTSLNFGASRAQGTGSPSAYTGRYKIETTTDGTTWTQVYPASGTGSDVANKTYPGSGDSAWPSGLVAVRCSLYLAGGMSTLLDQQVIPVVSEGATGATGAAGKDAYTVILTNESHTFAAGVSAATAGTATCGVIAYKGATGVSCYVGASSSATSISTNVTGLTCAISNNNSQNVVLTFTAATTLTTKSGTVSIPVVVDGKSFTKLFTFSLAMTGAKRETGATGAAGAKGADALTLVITTNNGNIFKNSNGSTTLTARVYKAGAEVTGSALTALGTIKWYKDGTYLSGKDGTSLVVNATDVTNKAAYTAQLEA